MVVSRRGMMEVMEVMEALKVMKLMKVMEVMEIARACPSYSYPFALSSSKGS
jgi:hypothetical protein